MKIKVSELEGEKLAEWAARAQGWLLVACRGESSFDWVYGFGHVIDRFIPYKDYRPDINGGQAMELQKKYGLDVKPNVIENGTIKSWSAGWAWPMKPKGGQIGETPEIAICRAVVASEYGEYVETEGKQGCKP